ncbi:MAG: Gfo/Idh/MocA family oxidoreductase [Oscillospiraceae bacterium]|nr:Gfo/Idh/MocA family oxidoreductase [Oscillospiraceae bacterium]
MKVRAIVIGYGSRGAAYSAYSAKHPEELEIVAVADPIENRRAYAKKLHGIAEDRLYTDWRELEKEPKMADFAIIATQDSQHLEPALAMIEKGYHLLLEKPMATTPAQCKRITEAAEKKGVKVIVCHVLRFTSFWTTLKNIIDSGQIGKVMSIIHMENVGNVHQSHSYVRGNWRRADESTPMILAKCCHDTDILQWLIGKPCKRVQSFGSLTHFTKENKPQGAPARCTDGCPHADTCFYNAVKLYYDDKDNAWFRGVAAKTVDNPSDEAVMDALLHGPYGRCVYDCDNDVVDHQIVNMEFEDGTTASLSMNAFNQGGRFIRVFGTKGEVFMASGEEFVVYSFADRQEKRIPVQEYGNSITDGHGGGDTGIMMDAVKYFGEGVASKSVCDVRMSYISHLIAFGAEASRLTGTVVDLDQYSQSLDN